MATSFGHQVLGGRGRQRGGRPGSLSASRAPGRRGDHSTRRGPHPRLSPNGAGVSPNGAGVRRGVTRWWREQNGAKTRAARVTADPPEGQHQVLSLTRALRRLQSLTCGDWTLGPVDLPDQGLSLTHHQTAVSRTEVNKADGVLESGFGGLSWSTLKKKRVRRATVV
jgi:hypothetical protein